MADVFKGVDLDNIDTGYILREGQKKLMKGLQMSSEPNPLGSYDFFSGFGEKIVGEINLAFVSNFSYQSDTRKLQTILANGGTVTNPDSVLKVSSGVNANGSAIGRSRRSLPYKAGQEAFCFFTGLWDAPVDNNKRFIGLFDNLNGFAVGYNNLDFGILRRKNSVDVEFVKQEDFNKDKLDGSGISGFNIETNTVNVFKVSFIYLGGGPIRYWVLGDNGWINFHTIYYQNRNALPHISLPYLKIGIENINTGNTTNVSVYSASVACGSVGGYDKIISSRNFVKKIKKTINSGTTTLAVFNLKDTYGGVENRVENLLKAISISADGTKNVEFERIRLAVPPTGGTWEDISINSMMRINLDPTMTVNFTGSELTFGTTLAKTESKDPDLTNRDKRGLPGDYIAYVVTSTAGSEITVITDWDELF